MAALYKYAQQACTDRDRVIRLRSFNAVRAERFGYKVTWTDRAILMRSKLHTHTELQFSAAYENISYSATMMDGSKCTRFKHIHYSHPERWDTVEIAVSAEQEKIIHDQAAARSGQEYDLFGLLSFSTPLEIIRPHKKKWWCTEICVYLLMQVFPGLQVRPDRCHPTIGDYMCRWFFARPQLTAGQVLRPNMN